MKIFLLKDVEKIGMAGEIVKVKEGFAKNFLVPRKLGTLVTPKNEAFFKQREKRIEKRNEVIQSQTSMLAQKISSINLKLNRKMHDDGKLYGAINPTEIVDLLSEKGVSISKSQVDFGKSIKSSGTYSVTIKLSSRLQPKVTLKVVPEK